MCLRSLMLVAVRIVFFHEADMPTAHQIQSVSAKRHDASPAATTKRDDRTAHATPENGDVVVRREKLEGRFVYLLHTVPGTAQYVLRTREEAVAQAAGFAKRHGVRAWLSGEGDDCVLLNDVRVVESIKS